jgi:hypothetical protein
VLHRLTSWPFPLKRRRSFEIRRNRGMPASERSLWSSSFGAGIRFLVMTISSSIPSPVSETVLLWGSACVGALLVFVLPAKSLRIASSSSSEVLGGFAMTSASSCSCEDQRRSSVSQSAFWVDASDSGTRCASARWLGEGVRIRLYSDHAELPQTQSWRLQLSHPSCSEGTLRTRQLQYLGQNKAVRQ